MGQEEERKKKVNQKGYRHTQIISAIDLGLFQYRNPYERNFKTEPIGVYNQKSRFTSFLKQSISRIYLHVKG